jgi:transposase
VKPDTAVDRARHEMACELLDDIGRLDTKEKELKRRMATAVEASGTTVTEVYCAGPVVACLVLGCTGDVTRFRDRHHCAAYNGTAPVEMSSAGRRGQPPVPARQPHAQ